MCHCSPSDYSIHQKSSLSPSPHPLNTARITLGVVSLHLPTPSTRNLFFLLHGIINTVKMIFWDADFLINFPSPRNHHFLLHRQCPFLHPAGSFFFPYHILSVVCELEIYLLSLSLEPGHAQPSSLVLFSCW